MRALVVGIGRFSAAVEDEVPVGARMWPDLPFVDEVAPAVAAALDRLGYATEVHRDVDAAGLRATVTTALGSARVVYVAAHGDAETANPHRVDVVPADGRVGAGTNAAQWVDDAQALGVPTLFLFDLCRSGRAASLPHLVHGSDTPAGAWVIAASGGGENAYDGRFSRALVEVLEEVARTGLDTDPARSHVPFSTVARRIRRRVERMPGMVQNIQSTAMVLALDEPELPFFPNPAYDPAAARVGGVDPALRVFLDPRDVGHFTDKAGGRFTGRRSQLRVLAPWLDDVEAGGVRVVAGSPGVGKSALLGALACAAHPELARLAPQVRERLTRDPQGCPSVNDRLAAVHARGRAATDVFASIAGQLDLLPGPDVPMDASTFVGLFPEGGEVPAVIVDALDEASDPGTLCAAVVRLACAVRVDGRPVVRLLVGTRAWPEFGALLDLATAAGGLTNLDDTDVDELRDDLTVHLDGHLATIPAYAPPRMRAIRHHLAHAVADHLTPRGERNAEWGAFLVAGIFVRHLAHVPTPVCVEQARDLGRSVPTTLPAVLDLDLASHREGDGIRAVLAAVAQARGEGMPLEVALPLAGLFADLDPEHTRTLPPDALFYLRATADRDGTLLYRLFHQALIDHLAHPSTASGPAPGEILDHLLDTHTTRHDRTRTWDSTPPYLLRHMPAHAEAAGRLDEFLVDAEYLVHGDPDTLVRAFPRAETEEALSARAVYRASIGVHRHVDPSTRRRILVLDAVRHDTPAFARELADGVDAGLWTAVAATGGLLDTASRDTLTGHTGAVVAVACTTLHGRSVAVTASLDHTVRVWDLATGRPHGEPLTGCGPWIVACTTLKGRPVAITTARDHTVCVWDLATRRQRPPLVGHTDRVRAVACTVVDGRPIAVTGSDDRTLRVWDLTTGRPRGMPFVGHTDGVRSVACAIVDGRPVAVSGGDHTVRVWDLTTGRPRGRPLEGPVVRMVSIPTGWPVVVVAAHDGTVRMWDLTTGKPHREPLTGHTRSVNAVACTRVHGRSAVVTGADDDTVRMWDLSTGMDLGEPFIGHTDSVLAVACTIVDGHPVVVTGSADKTVRVWDLAIRRRYGDQSAGHTDRVLALACTTVNGVPVAVSGGNDRTVRTWNLATGTPHGEYLTGHTASVLAVACTIVDGHSVAVTGGDDRTVRIWNLATGTPHDELFTGHEHAVSSVECTVLHGRPVVITGTDHGSTRVWDLQTLRQLGELEGYAGWARACTTLDGHPTVVTGGVDGRLHVWDLATRRPYGPYLSGPHSPISAVACTVLDGRPIAVTGSGHGTVHVWDLTTRQPPGEPLTRHNAPVHTVACTLVDGQPVAVTAAGDGMVQVWDLGTRRCIDRIPLPAPCSALALDNAQQLVIGFDMDVAVLTRNAPQRSQDSRHRSTDTTLEKA